MISTSIKTICRILLLLLVLQVIFLSVYIDLQYVMMPTHAEMFSIKYYIT